MWPKRQVPLVILGCAMLAGALAASYEVTEAGSIATFGLALAALAPAVVPALNYSKTGRRTSVALAVLTAAVGLLAWLFLDPETSGPTLAFILGPLWVVGGALQVLRG